MLETAREQKDAKREAEARRQLKRLGVKVIYQTPQKTQ
jgi:hypothetical protein